MHNINLMRYFLIGDPVEHSLSPLIMNYLFRKYGINAIYHPARVIEDELMDILTSFREIGVRGFNVTMPLKTAILRFLDDLDDSAYTIKAVNTVKNIDEALVGYNTDWIGVLRSLETYRVGDIDTAAVLGAGGAAKASIYALSKISGKVYVLNRTYEKAIALKKKLRELDIEIVPLRYNINNLEMALNDAELVINATPIGMNKWESPIPSRLLREDLYVMDMVYRPLKTKLLNDALDAGARVIDGLWMLITQAAEAFKIWTGIYPDIYRLRRFVLGEIT